MPRVTLLVFTVRLSVMEAPTVKTTTTRFLSLTVILFLGAAVSVAIPQEKNPLAGTWIANIEKSKRHPNHLFKSAKLTFKISGPVVTLTYSGVNMSGVEETGTTLYHPDGEEHPLEAMPGATELSRWASPRRLETTVKKDGKLIGQSNFEVSNDGKTLTATIKGTDAAGASFEQIIVCDRE